MEWPKLHIAVAFMLSCMLMADALKVNEVARKFEMAGLLPVIKTAPPNKLNVTWETATAELGNTICPTRTTYAAKLEYDTTPGKNYTIIYFDADVPSQAAPTLRSYLLGMRINSPGENITSGFLLAPLVPPAPPPGSGPHRYVVLLYKQSKFLNPRNMALLSVSMSRSRFNVIQFACKYGLGDPVAGNFFISSVSSDYEKECNMPRYDSQEL